MTTSDYKKVLKQIGKKPGKVAKYKKYNTPRQRTGGVLERKCRRCGRTHAHIRKYGLGLCRTCFRDIAPDIGFKKYN